MTPTRTKLEKLVVIDEAQRQPKLFPVLRMLADRPTQPATFLILGALSTALDKAIAAQDQNRFDDAYAVCQKKAAEAGLDQGCGCCIVGVILKWSQPAHGPTWLDRLGGRTAGYGPSGMSTLGSVTGTFYISPCDEVHDPGVWLDWSSTYENHKISF